MWGQVWSHDLQYFNNYTKIYGEVSKLHNLYREVYVKNCKVEEIVITRSYIVQISSSLYKIVNSCGPLE